MSGTKTIKEARRSGNKGPSQAQAKFPNSITFHPTKAESEVLRSQPIDMERDLESLSTYLDASCVLSIGVRQDSGSYYATMREKTSSWQDAPALTAWHSTVTGALKGLAFALANRYPDFPENLPSKAAFTDEW